MKISCEYNVKSNREKYDLDYLKENRGVYVPIDDPDTRLINIDEDLMLYVNGDDVEKLDKDAWTENLFYKTNDAVTITIQG